MALATLSNPIQGRQETGGPNTGMRTLSPYHDKRIQAGLSTQILIKAQGYDGQWYDVGAVQNFSVQESRPLAPIQEVGTDGIIQITPSAAAPLNITVERCVFDYQRVTVAFQRGFQHVMSQRFPFDIVVLDYNPYVVKSGANFNYDAARDSATPIITRFVNCWFESLGYSYAAENYLIRENATLKCEAVYDQINKGIIFPQSGTDDAVERDHDRSLYNGVMVESYVAINNVTSLST